MLQTGRWKTLKKSNSGAWTFECTVEYFAHCHVKHGWMLSSGYWTISTGKLLLNQPGKGSKGTFTCTPLSWAVQSGAAWLSTPAQAWMCVMKTSAYPLPITCFSLEGNQSRKVARDSQGAMLPLLEDGFPSHPDRNVAPSWSTWWAPVGWAAVWPPVQSQVLFPYLRAKNI